MQHQIIVVLVALFSAASAQQGCGQGKLNTVTGCCVCDLGYSGSHCTECANGYVKDRETGICSNGRPGSLCLARGAFPYFGCSGHAGECSEGNVFPCVCAGGEECPEQPLTSTAASSQCYPEGSRMFTTYPNEPTLGTDFSITVHGCSLTSSRRYAVIPAYTQDLSKEFHCGNLEAEPSWDAGCVFGARDNITLGGDALCKGGFLLEGTDVAATGEDGMGEVTKRSILFQDEGVFAGEPGEVRDMRNKEGRGEKEAFFRVCEAVLMPTAKGGVTTVWKTVASHNPSTDARDEDFKVSRSLVISTLAASDYSGDGDNKCCDGLKLGSLCLPLWVFLLLWFLMACCLGGMGFMLHKNSKEIDAVKNNERYEKFNVDSEMTSLAAQRDGGEGDDI